ncbi:hypothetical protein AAVH_26018 [Aphelenchoides avenae]|nr:hypothetical protein AAVH_26018 [Aphelenchus avenae]
MEKTKKQREKEKRERADSRERLKGVCTKDQLEAGTVTPSKAAAYFALPLRPKRHYTGSKSLLLLLLLVSRTAVAQARKRGQESEEPQVIKEKFRIVQENQSPAHWRTWTNRGMDCVLMTSVWEFLVLPEVPKMLNRCGKPLCKMLKSIAKKKRLIFSLKQFSKCYELAKLLGYDDLEATGADGYHGIPTLVHLLLTLSSESAEIKERFEAVSEVIRFCNGKRVGRIVVRLPFIIVQQLNFDYLSDGDTIFAQAAPIWLRRIFAEDQLRRAAGGLKDDRKDFFGCDQGELLTLSFRFRYMSEKATHAVFLLQPPTRPWLESKGQMMMDPDAAGYSGQVSLARNRHVWFEVPEQWASGSHKDFRHWELYSCSLAALIRTTQIDPDESDVNDVESTRK